MEKVKVRNLKTAVVKEVEKAIASDYIGTKEWELVKEDKVIKKDFVEMTRKSFDK